MKLADTEESTPDAGSRWRAVIGIILFAVTVAGLWILGVGE